MHFFLGCLESRRSCALPEAQGTPSPRRWGCPGQSSPRLAVWRGLGKPRVGEEGAGRGLLSQGCQFPARWPGAAHHARGTGGRGSARFLTYHLGSAGGEGASEGLRTTQQVPLTASGLWMVATPPPPPPSFLSETPFPRPHNIVLLEDTKSHPVS